MATIGLSKPYYAIYAEAGGVVSYSDGAVMGKATEANISIETTEDNNLYGDNGLAETDRRFANGTLTLSTTDLSQEVSKAILGLTEQAITGIDGVTDTSVKELVYDDTQVTPYLGVGFIIKKKVNGAYKWRGVVLPKVLEVITFAPALKYAACTARTASGLVMFQTSGDAPAGRPAACSMVPMPPSNTRCFCENESKNDICSELLVWSILSCMRTFLQRNTQFRIKKRRATLLRRMNAQLCSA